MSDRAQMPASYDEDISREPGSMAEVIDLEPEPGPCEPGACDGHTEPDAGFGGQDITRYCDAESTGYEEPAGRRPVNPELFARTAPQWNCVDYPGDGPHYTAGNDCSWCGMTREEITHEYEAGG